ncbi:MAG: glycosyltransferase [Planctomycetota bacterium]|jgi:glycosyltransferase involved in cell wall biosynthesis
MHVLYVHKNFPAQFGHLADYLIEHEGFRCTFLSERKAEPGGRIERVRYRLRGGARPTTHYCSRTFENFVWRCHAVYETMKTHPEIRPDLVVGHSGFGSTLYLEQLYDCPIVNFCEWYYHPDGGESKYRDSLVPTELNALRSQTRNAMFLLDLQACDAGYSPTNWQRSQIPAEYQPKLRTVFDGIDTELWRPLGPDERGPRKIGDREIPDDVKIVTYVSRGFEEIRGFDVFVEVARRICGRRDDVLFVCVGENTSFYGSEDLKTGGSSFRDHVLIGGDFDPERFLFTARVPPEELARIFSLSDLHLYLTAPFVLSWSMLNALACGTPLLASDTEPVREVIHHGHNGLLAPFFDADTFTELALDVLADPPAYRPLQEAGLETIHRRYSLKAVIPDMLGLYHDAAAGRLNAPGPRQPTTEPMRVTAAPGTDPLELLAAQDPWPDQQPSVTACRDDVRMPAGHRETLSKVLSDQTRLVAELGAWNGLSTRLIARAAPRATIIAVDEWKETGDGNGQWNWKPQVPELFARFLANCWPWRDRVIPLASSVAGAVEQLCALEIVPEVLFFHATHTPTLEEDLQLVLDRFGSSVVIGDHWRWPRLERAVAALNGNGALETSIPGDTWRVSP